MRIATFNINDVVKRLDNLLAWLAATAPDVVCLQELKCEARAFPHAALREVGYGAAIVGQRTWNGVAILAKGHEPIVTRTALPGDETDSQARYIEAAVAGILVASIYAPNGNPQPGPKFDYKLAWLERLIAHAAALKTEGVPVVLAGDYNVAPTERDIYPTRSWDKDALIQPASRDAFSRLVAQGWTDALRDRLGDKRLYTFWSYKRDRFARDAGLRLDHILLSESLAPRLAGVGAIARCVARPTPAITRRCGWRSTVRSGVASPRDVRACMPWPSLRAEDETTQGCRAPPSQVSLRGPWVASLRSQ